MVQALMDTQKSLATHFGAIVCLHMLGIHVVDAILLENIPLYWHECLDAALLSLTVHGRQHLQPFLSSSHPLHQDALKVEDALLVGRCCNVMTSLHDVATDRSC